MERTHEQEEQLKNESKVDLFPRETRHVPVQRRGERRIDKRQEGQPLEKGFVGRDKKMGMARWEQVLSGRKRALQVLVAKVCSIIRL